MVRLYFLIIKYLIVNIYKINTSLVLFFLLISSSFVNSQDFIIPKSFKDVPLLHMPRSNLEGIFKIIPNSGLFSMSSSIELSIINENILSSTNWIKDYLYGQLGNIAETERMLRSVDSPFSDPIFNDYKKKPLYIEDTLFQLTNNPFVFCQGPYVSSEKMQKFKELSCIFPFGLFRKYVIIRLVFIEKKWFLIKLESFNENRINQLYSIANSFYMKE